jgi:hypothetical protein
MVPILGEIVAYIFLFVKYNIQLVGISFLGFLEIFKKRKGVSLRETPFLFVF